MMTTHIGTRGPLYAIGEHTTKDGIVTRHANEVHPDGRPIQRHAQNSVAPLESAQAASTDSA